VNVEISVDTVRCVGAGQCVLAAPDVFDQDDDGIVTVLDEKPPPEQWAAARDAADVCPSGTIGYAED
jgi:ferredoxin